MQNLWKNWNNCIFTIFLSKVWEKRYQIIWLAIEQRFSTCPVRVSDSVRIKSHQTWREKISEITESRRRAHSDVCVQFGVHPVTCPQSLFLTMTISRGHRWSVLSGFLLSFSSCFHLQPHISPSPCSRAPGGQSWFPLQGILEIPAGSQLSIPVTPVPPSLHLQSLGDCNAIFLLPRLCTNLTARGNEVSGSDTGLIPISHW